MRLKLWQIGLIISILAGLINTLLMKSGIGGSFRELMRLSILIGLVLLVVGLFRRSKK